MQSHTALSQTGKTPPAGIIAQAITSKSAATSAPQPTIRPPLTPEQQKRQDEVFAASVGYNINRLRKAVAARDAKKRPSRADKQAVWDAVTAVAKAKPDTARQAAEQWRALVLHDPDGHLRFDFDQLAFAETLIRLTEPPAAKKLWRATETKAGKLTRQGLLYRYHSLLFTELMNVGIELYGCAGYASHMFPCDGYVQRRCDPPGWPKGIGKDLPVRAAKVLRSLRIDIKYGDGEHGRKARTRR